MPDISTPHRISLVSIQWLKYLGIVSVFLSLYAVIQFYYKFGDDIFPKSLTIGQHIKLVAFSIGSMLSELITPLLFFSGALLYRSVRLKGISPLSALKPDLLLILPLGITLWFYGAFYETQVEAKFYTMLFEVKDLKRGEKLVQDPATYELIVSPNINGLRKKIATLNLQIKDAEDKLVNELAVQIPPSQVDSIIGEIDFGSSSIESKDILNSSVKWDGNKRDLGFLKSYSLPRVYYIKSLKNQLTMYEDEIKVIHLKPLYVLLFLVFGMLLGYLIPLHKAALTAILVAIGFAWYYGTTILEVSLGMGYSNTSWFLIGKIGLLTLVNTTLLIAAIKVYGGFKPLVQEND